MPKERKEVVYYPSRLREHLFKIAGIGTGILNGIKYRTTWTIWIYKNAEVNPYGSRTRCGNSAAGDGSGYAAQRK